MKSSVERLEWALKSCEEAHVRMTAVRTAILKFLSEQRIPVNLEAIARVRGIGDRRDATTVYRTLMMFKDAGLVRTVGALRKTSLFILRAPEETSHFLICERCGALVAAQLPPEEVVAIGKLALKHGFAATFHCVEVQGLCRSCAKQPRSGAVSKMMARHFCE